MEECATGVLIAIDWENIRRGALMYQTAVTPQAVAHTVTAVGRIFGEVLGGKAFGDWSLRPEDDRAFAKAEITLYHAPRTMAGKDRSDPSILMEVYDWMRDREDCGFIILGSGDSDYQVLVDRARARDRRIILCAFSQAVGREMIAAAALFPLEAELGIHLAEHGDVEVKTNAPPRWWCRSRIASIHSCFRHPGHTFRHALVSDLSEVAAIPPTTESRTRPERSGSRSTTSYALLARKLFAHGVKLSSIRCRCSMYRSKSGAHTLTRQVTPRAFSMSGAETPINITRSSTQVSGESCKRYSKR